MKFYRQSVEGVVLVATRKFTDDRGYFSETFRLNAFCEFIGHEVSFVQDNCSLSHQEFTVRGLHYQSPPYAQGKLVRCSRGSIIDVAVDARKDSKTYGQHVTAKLNAENGHQLWIPEGFLHGFATLEPDTEVQYKCTNYYNAESDGSVLWNDTSLNIEWGFDPIRAKLSDKDTAAPAFNTFKSPF